MANNRLLAIRPLQLGILALGIMMSIFVLRMGRVHAAPPPGVSTNVLNNQVVSYINATCEADPLNCPGAYHSKQSLAFLYVPTSIPTASVTLTNLTKNGITSFRLQPLSDSPIDTCLAGVDIPSGAVPRNPINGDTLSITNAQVGIRQVPNPALGVTYNTYCVWVETGPSLPLLLRENVGYALLTPAGSLLGVYPGFSNLGTGFFGGNGLPYAPPTTNWWSQDVAFSPPCNGQGSGTMTLYDLDTYSAANASMILYVSKILKPNETAATSPDGGAPGVSYRVALSGNLAQLGGNIYQVGFGPSGSSWPIDIIGEPYYPNYIYSLHIDNIGSANRIRIKLPYDQINSVVQCTTGIPPSCTVSTLVGGIPRNPHPGEAFTARFAVTAPAGGPGFFGYEIGVNGHAIHYPGSNYGAAPLANEVEGVRGLNYLVGNNDWYIHTGIPINIGPGATQIVDVSSYPLVFNTGAPGPPYAYSVVGTTMVAPGGLGTYDFDWGFVIPGGNWDPAMCDATLTVDPFNNLPVGSINANCDAAGVLTVIIGAIDPDGGVPGVSATIGPLTTLNSVGTFTSPGQIPAPPRDNVVYTATLTLTDAQTNESVAGGSDTYQCPLPPATVTCSIGAAANMEAGGSWIPTMVITHTGPVFSPSITVRATITVNGQTANLPAPGTVTIAQGAPAASFTLTPNISILNPGTYQILGTVRDVSGAPSNVCNAVIQVLNLPYLKVYGNDVQAGSGFKNAAGACTVSATRGNAKAFIHNDATFSGAGSQLAVFALQRILGFRSASTRAGAGALPQALSFSNTVNVALPLQNFGGLLTGNNICAADYFNDKDATTAKQFPASVDLATVALPANGQIYTGPTTVTASAGIPNGRKIALFVEGNAYIDASVVYGAWGSVAAIPSVFVVATGNIYIKNDIAQLDGTYVSYGNIYTCARNGSVYLPAEIYDNCRNRLTINGSFIAQQVRFLRSIDSLRSSRPSNAEYPAAGAAACAASGASAPVCAAEVFNFSPEVYLTSPALTLPSTATSNLFDAITSLPPVF